LGTKKFKRLRIGVGYDNKFFIKDWVLDKFSESEKKITMKITPILLDSMLEWIKESKFEIIMNKFNNFDCNKK
jgi:peptidyl-tRNA hydrolase